MIRQHPHCLLFAVDPLAERPRLEFRVRLDGVQLFGLDAIRDVDDGGCRDRRDNEHDPQRDTEEFERVPRADRVGKQCFGTHAVTATVLSVLAAGRCNHGSLIE
jgi:hypothetical protein